MIVQSIGLINKVQSKEYDDNNDTNNKLNTVQLPRWVEERQSVWGELLVVLEWEDKSYCNKHG